LDKRNFPEYFKDTEDFDRFIDEWLSFREKDYLIQGMPLDKGIM